MSRPEKPGPDATSAEIAEWLEEDFWATVAEGAAELNEEAVDDEERDKRYLDLSDLFVSESGQVLTRERLRRGVLHGEVQTTDEGFLADGERFTPIYEVEDNV